MSARSLELQSLRRELRAGQDLLEQLEARIAALEQEGFEFVDPLPGASQQAPPSPFPGSGGGYLSRGSVVPALPGSGGGQLSQASSQVPIVPSTPLGRPGSGGVDLGLALDLEDTFLTEAPEPIQGLQPLVQDCCCSGGRAVFEVSAGRRTFEVLGTERSELELLVLCDFQGRRCAEPCIFSSFGPCKNLCCRGPDKGRSIFVGLPPQTEVAEALRAADLSWPSEGLDVQPRWV